MIGPPQPCMQNAFGPAACNKLNTETCKKCCMCEVFFLQKMIINTYNLFCLLYIEALLTFYCNLNGCILKRCTYRVECISQWFICFEVLTIHLLKCSMVYKFLINAGFCMENISEGVTKLEKSSFEDLTFLCKSLANFKSDLSKMILSLT